MTIEERLVTALEPLASGGIFADTAPLANPYPFITYQQVGGQPVTTLCGDNDVNARIQFNVWAQTRNEANTLMRLLAAIVTAPPFRAVSQGSLVAEYNVATKGRGARQDFSFWQQE